jgi:heme exporter protein A
LSASEPARAGARSGQPDAAPAGARSGQPDVAPAGAPSGQPLAAPALELRGLTRHFGERTALSGLTLTLPAGAALAVLGRNGAGKSTLLRILATLLRPHGGEVSILGEPLPRRAWAVRGRLGYLGHDPLLYRDLTGRENLTYHARLHRVPQTRVEELLEAVGMRRRADDPVRLLSRGMVQRLAVCRAVLHRPQLLLLDEPRANLDPGAEALVEPLIGAGAGVTRVLTSHDPRAALAEADLVLGLREGRQAFLTTPDALAGAELEALYA